jgi:hypothetical protein
VRAVLIDKDNSPKWRHEAVEQVSERQAPCNRLSVCTGAALGPIDT